MTDIHAVVLRGVTIAMVILFSQFANAELKNADVVETLFKSVTTGSQLPLIDWSPLIGTEESVLHEALGRDLGFTFWIRVTNRSSRGTPLYIGAMNATSTSLEDVMCIAIFEQRVFRVAHVGTILGISLQDPSDWYERAPVVAAYNRTKVDVHKCGFVSSGKPEGWRIFDLRATARTAVEPVFGEERLKSYVSIAKFQRLYPRGFRHSSRLRRVLETRERSNDYRDSKLTLHLDKGPQDLERAIRNLVQAAVDEQDATHLISPSLQNDRRRLMSRVAAAGLAKKAEAGAIRLAGSENERYRVYFRLPRKRLWGKPTERSVVTVTFARSDEKNWVATQFRVRSE